MKPDIELDATLARFERDVIAGLSAAPKTLPCQYFYDAEGSRLFEEITELEEYYPTRTEISILQACAPEIAARTAEGCLLVEFGSGSAVKTSILIDAAPAITGYVPIDVSASIMEQAVARLTERHPGLVVDPVIGDFTSGLRLPAALLKRPRLGFFPGSTIGNFGMDEAAALLARFRQALGPGARLVLGADLRKSAARLVPAYDDARGVTAAFNLNLLARINRELGGTFDLDQFQHLATYDDVSGRVDMHLVSRRSQIVTVAGRRFGFAAGERIHTEVSQKYSIDEMKDLGRRAGWSPVAVWTDPENLFSVHEFG